MRTGLGGKATVGQRGDAVKPLTESTNAIGAEMPSERLEEGERRFSVSVHLEVRQRERTEEPPPRRALVIGSVPLPRTATIASLVLRVARIEAAEPEGCQQVPRE